MVEAAGYPDNEHAIKNVAEHVGVPYNTLRRWVRGKHVNNDANKIVAGKKTELVDELKKVALAAVPHMLEALEDAGFRDLTIGVGVIIDKVQLLSEQPTERNETRLVVERNGITSVPEHLASGPASGNRGALPIQRGGVWPEMGEDVSGDGSLH